MLLTWNTVSRLCQKLSKFDLGLSSSGCKLPNFPPNTCMPSSEKITMNKKRSSKSEKIDWIEFKSDATRFESDCQYLKKLFSKESSVNKCSYSLCDLKHPQQTNTPQHRHAKWRHYLSVCQNHFCYASNDDETIEAIKERDEVSLET